MRDKRPEIKKGMSGRHSQDMPFLKPACDAAGRKPPIALFRVFRGRLGHEGRREAFTLFVELVHG